MCAFVSECLVPESVTDALGREIDGSAVGDLLHVFEGSGVEVLDTEREMVVEWD